MFHALCLGVTLTIGQSPTDPPFPPPELPRNMAVPQIAPLPDNPAPVRQANPPSRALITIEPTAPAALPSLNVADPGQPTTETPKKANGNGESKKDEEKKDEEKKEPTKYLFMKVLEGTPIGARMAEKGWSISGWTQMSFTGSTARTSNLPMTFNDQANQFQLNQNFLRIDKTIDQEKKEVQWGGRIEAILPGTDARFTVPRGLWDAQLRNGPNGGAIPYPIDLYNFYGEVYLPNIGDGTTVRLGRFATHCEYEVTEGAETPFLSRSYTFQYNPFTHTGIWATTKLNSDWTVGYGLGVGSDNFIDPANRLTYLGQIKWTPDEGKKTTVLLNVVITDPKFFVRENFAFYNTYNLQWIEKVTEKFTNVFETTFSHMDNIPDVGSANWFGLANYFIFAHNEKVTSTLRAEIFNDQKGVRTGFEGLYFETTYGVSWTPKNWLMIRPFARFDYNWESTPFEGKHGLGTGGLDVIVRW